MEFHFIVNRPAMRNKKDCEPQMLCVRGARENNLKDVDIDIPRGQFTVITGVSGSGKSSLAFNVIYNEGQRRYLEGLSAYARNYLDVGSKPQVDRIENLSPTIAIDQKSIARSPRSTVGTLTEIYDYLRLLFSKTGQVHCPSCKKVLIRQTGREIMQVILESAPTDEIRIFSRLRSEGVETLSRLARYAKEGYSIVRLSGREAGIREVMESGIPKVPVEVLVDRFTLKKAGNDKERILDSLEESFKMGEECVVAIGKEERCFQQNYRCIDCGVTIGDLTPRHFSFNNPEGACPSCSGLGRKLTFDPALLVSNPKLTLIEGAVGALNRFMGKAGTQTGFWKSLEAFAAKKKINLTKPVGKFSKTELSGLFAGEKPGSSDQSYPGIIPFLEGKYRSSSSEHLRADLERYMNPETCDSCLGRRLRKESLAVTVGERNIAQWSGMNLAELDVNLKGLVSAHEPGSESRKMIDAVVGEILARLAVLVEIGVSYLTLDRTSLTLSGGEAQRIRLSMQLVSKLSGVMYILDEPSMGLHSRDTLKLIRTFRELLDAGNSVIVVEHDRDIMEAAQWMVDMGPGAGEEGGNVVFSGPYEKLLKSKSLTAQYLRGEKHIGRKSRAVRKDMQLTVKGATEHNLKNIDASFPLGVLTVVTGVSGSGKSTLVRDILSKALRRHFHGAKESPGKYGSILGLDHIDKVISIDQEAIGRTSRSNVATYTGVFSLVRDVFASTPLSQSRGYEASRFSFNLKGGRCEMCQGEGVRKIEMYLMPDMYVDCEACSGTRYNSKTLEVEYHGATIADVLGMSVGYAKDFFRKHPHILDKLEILEHVGLGYLRLGQGAPDLSGGEAQRIKLAAELARKATGKTLYILDEPTIGLHFEDIRRLLNVIDSLLEKGNTVIVVEHNMEMARCADWVIDLGPEGGDGGGNIVCSGTPDEIKKCAASWTGKYL